MNPVIILILSIVLQVIAAISALRLIRVTGRTWAWSLIAVALVLMIVRRGITLFELLVYGARHPLDFSTELVGLIVSGLLTIGIACIFPLFHSIRTSQEALRLNEARLAAVWELNQMGSAALQEVTGYTLDAAVNLTRSQVGFVGLLDHDEANLEILSWSSQVMSECAIHDKPMVYSLATAGLWGEAVRRRQTLLVNDYAASHTGKKGFPSGHVFLQRLLVVPVFDGGRVTALAAVANKSEPYDDQDSRQLSLLLQGMWRHIRRQRSEQDMVHQIERMHQFQTKLIQTSNDGIVASDRQGNILIFNTGAEKILGYRQENVIGKMKVQDLYPPNHATQILKLLLSPHSGGPGRLINHETAVFAKSGELIPVELSASLITNDHDVSAVVGFFRDLRERRLLQEQLLQNERLVVLGQMAAHISHEIKNPLMVIGGFARQVKENFDGPREKNLEKLQIVVDETKRLEGFLEEVGRYAKFSEPRLSMGDLNFAIRNICRFLEPVLEERGIVLQLDLDPALPSFPFDPDHIRQVLFNLLKNGIEAMQRSGTLSVSSHTTSKRILVHITDTGPGIPPEVLARIFQPFFSTKTKGSGLGLAISQQIMAAHQGEINIRSEPGKGAQVTLAFRLPDPG
jgi:PAS domain S-box-containing protein